jgi:hypothetical protein
MDISSSMSMVDYIKHIRKKSRLRVHFIHQDKFDKIANIEKFNLSGDQLRVFFPSSSEPFDIEYTDKDNHEYENEYITSGMRANTMWLNRRLPTIHPPPDYFREDELELLMAQDSPLQFPPLYYIRKFVKKK